MRETGGLELESTITLVLPANRLVLKYKGKGDIFIMGDLNARTGNKGNIHNNKLNEHLKDILPNSDEPSDLTKRCSNDLKTNTSGNTLR